MGCCLLFPKNHIVFEVCHKSQSFATTLDYFWRLWASPVSGVDLFPGSTWAIRHAPHMAGPGQTPPGLEYIVMKALKIAGAAVAAVIVFVAVLLIVGIPSGFLTSAIQDRVERETGYRLTIAGST